MYISSVALNNFRCYRRAETTFVHPGANLDLPKGALNNVTLLLGTNGSGKTSVLRAVALAVLAPIIRETGFRPYYLTRRTKGVELKSRLGASEKMTSPAPSALIFGEWKPTRGESSVEGSLAFHTQDIGGRLSNAVETEGNFSSALVIHRRQDYESLVPVYYYLNRGATNIYGTYYSDNSAGYFLLGYGATRRTNLPRNVSPSESKKRSPRYQRVAGLFEDDDVALTPLGVWLEGLAQAARTKRASRPFRAVKQLLQKTLPRGAMQLTNRFIALDPVFRLAGGVQLPYGALSDGYRGFIGLVGDILYHLYTCCPEGEELTNLSGVVMVDDIDLHLHPQWQRVVVPRLAKAFPKLQFILTTHSPLVAGTVHAANVRVIGKNQVHQFDERLHGLSVDQILSSRYFGYTKPRSVDAEKALKELLDGPNDEGDPGPALEFLKALSGNESTAP